MQSEYDEIIASVKSSAKSAGYTYKNYVKAMYGTLVTTGVFESMAKDSVLLTSFQNDYLSKLNYTDEEIEKYYQDNKSTFDVADYDYIRFSGTTSATKDADGNTVDATQEEMDAAIAAAKDGANAALARFRNGESLEDIAKDYDIATYYPVTDGSNTSDTVATWVFEKATAAGESTVLDDGTEVVLDDGVFEVTFIKRPKNLLELNETLTALVLAEIDERYMYSFRTSRLTVEAGAEVPWTLDGEYGGDHGYVCIEARKHAMELVLNNK